MRLTVPNTEHRQHT